MDGDIDLKCYVSAEDYEKRENLNEIWTKMSFVLCFLMGKKNPFEIKDLIVIRQLDFLIGIFPVMLE
jgi:hypothetical protein